MIAKQIYEKSFILLLFKITHVFVERLVVVYICK